MALDPRRTDQGDASRLGRTRRSTYASILFERLFPTLLGLASVAAVFFILSWFGVFAAVESLVRVAILGLLACAAFAVVWRLRRVRLPSRDAVDRRIEDESRLTHQPLLAQSDRPTGDDPFARALWREHQRRMAERLKTVSGGGPRAHTERLDPLALRAVLALLLVAAFAYSYGSGGGRVSDAFETAAVPAGPRARVDAWVTPPTYTGRAPIFLSDAAADGRTGAADKAIEVPVGSILSIRMSDGSDASLHFTPNGGEPQSIAPGGLAAADAAHSDAAALSRSPDDGDDLAEAAPPKAGAPASAATPAGADPAEATPPPGEFEFRLEASGSAALTTTFATLGAWSFEVTPDRAPIIAFAGEPTSARNGALELSYTVDDDYGVRSGRVEIDVEDEAAGKARPLIPAPDITLAMPRRGKGEAKGRTSADITESPYAGARVTMTLVATDDAEQTGRSAAKALVLPSRRFTNPLARAVIEQRRILAFDADAARRVVDMLDAVTLRGEEFIADPSDYLALRAVRTRIATAADDETLVSAVDFLWEIALGIEDGNLSLAERKLRDAREQLSEALENGASDAELDQLMKELREAMQEYMQAMQEAAKNMPPLSQEDMANMQEIRPQDLERLLDQIEDLAKSGSKDAAKELLSELQSMMDNLQAMQPNGQQQSGENSAMQEQMDKLGEMLRRQQQLKDQTFDLGRRQVERQQRQNGQPGEETPMSDEDLARALEKLQGEQEQLQKDLQEMQEAMKGMGLKPGEGFGEADEAMGRAGDALGEGEDGQAVGEQGRAMEALRRGARDMMQQMQQAMGQGEGQQPGQPGQGQMGGGFGRGEQRSSRDPLGRPRSTQGPDFGQDVEVPDEIDTQRARRILDSIREKLGNQLSPQQEREYLERLLQTP